ncbi:MAG: hypothetical protein RR255_00390 [Bacilli bacterium]
MEEELELENEEFENNLKLKRLYHKRNIEYEMIEKENKTQWEMEIESSVL